MLDTDKTCIAESVGKARHKADVQRERLARMAPEDRQRANEERILDVMTTNVALATVARLLAPEIDPQASDA